MAQTFDDRPGVIWYNGELVPWKQATLHVLSHGLHYASAVFEGERAYGGVVFKLDDHTRRLHESARLLGKSHWWLRKLAKRGRLGFIRVGRQHRLMFPVSELLKLLEAQKNNK